MFYGIIVDLEEEAYFFGEVIYEIYCVDGVFRYFMEDEIELMSWLTSS